MPVYHLMEDAATAEISRSQIWQWIRSPKGVLDDGRKVTRELVRELLPEELAKVRALLGEIGVGRGRIRRGGAPFRRASRRSDDYVEFLTLPGYDRLTRGLRQARERLTMVRSRSPASPRAGLFAVLWPAMTMVVLCSTSLTASSASSAPEPGRQTLGDFLSPAGVSTPPGGWMRTARGSSS